MTLPPEPPAIPSLPTDVRDRLLSSLQYGAKIVACLRTAETFVSLAHSDPDDLRFAESVAYNLREALDAVVADQAVDLVDLRKVLIAWRRYKELDTQDQDQITALTELEQALQQAAIDSDRGTMRDHQLLGYYQRRTKLKPISGSLGPVETYSRLRKRSNTGLHEQLSVPSALALYEDTVTWFIRMFTPPSELLAAISELAGEDYVDGVQVARLQQLVTDDHHLRFFFSRVVDSNWLRPLYDAGLIALPKPGLLWSPAYLQDGLGQAAPDMVADVLALLERDLQRSSMSTAARVPVGYELLRVAWRLGIAGHTVAETLISKYRDNENVRTIAELIGLSEDAPADSSIVLAAARVTLIDRNPSSEILEKLEGGLTNENGAGRIRMLAGTLKAFVGDDRFHLDEDSTALTTELDERADSISITAHFLARALILGREYFPTAELLDWISGLPGHLGERLACQALAGAADIQLDEKLNHITRRLTSSTATGDDQVLVNDILSHEPTEAQLHRWTDALGAPSSLTDGAEDTQEIPKDWARVWRWSMLLPRSAVAPWHDPIAWVTALRGAPNPAALTTREPRFWMRSSRSPIPDAELTALPAVEAARLIAAWRPDQDAIWNLESARSLARAMEQAVQEDVEAWTDNPGEIVATLNEPIYILHYLAALKERAADLGERTPSILDAVFEGSTPRPAPLVLGRDDFEYEPTWDNVDTAIVDLTRAIANHDGQLTDHLDQIWELALALAMGNTPDEDQEPAEPDNERDYLHHAINSRRGHGLQAVIALAGWEHRTTGSVRTSFAQHLDAVLRRHGNAGMEDRAILAAERRRLEACAPNWLDVNADTLFRVGSAGIATFDLTLRWSRPSDWLYDHFEPDLVRAVRRSAENAVQYLVVAVVRNFSTSYEIDRVLNAFAQDTDALHAIATASARMVQGAEPGASVLMRAMELWRSLVGADRSKVPARSLRGLGAWSFVDGAEDAVWADQMLSTLKETNGQIDYLDGVANRIRKLPPAQAIPLLLLVLGTGESWKANYVEEVGLEVLTRAIEKGLVGDQVSELRSRLIELGRDEAA